jgi:uncharacterized membrane protein (UPF0127 family)
LSRCLAICLVLQVFTACAAQEKIHFEKQELILENAGGTVRIQAEIARTRDEHQQGFMFRKEVKDGEGMLFIFAQDQILSFWMKNTLVPLSIAFINSDGKIMEIRDMEAGDLHSIHSSRSGRYALEVPKGWFDRVGLGPGDRLVSFPLR